MERRRYIMKKSNRKIKAANFDNAFDSGDDMSAYLDTAKVRVNRRIQRINVDFPIAILSEIDKEAHKIGVARTALIKLWIAERLERV